MVGCIIGSRGEIAGERKPMLGDEEDISNFFSYRIITVVR